MRVCAICCQHLRFPQLEPHDLTLIMGDILDGNPNQQRNFYHRYFLPWLRSIPSRQGLVIAGNHDWLAFQYPEEFAFHLPPNWTYLQDSEALVPYQDTVFRVWGTPWTPIFYNWAFNASEDQQREYFSKIPSGLDILMSHGPPLGILDKNVQGVSCGSEQLYRAVSRAKPAIHLFGHIHEARGYLQNQDTQFYNVSYLDEHYQETRLPVYFDVTT